MQVEIPFENAANNETDSKTGSCAYKFVLYPTRTFEDEYRTSLPLVMTLIVGCIFAVMASTFFLYDCFVQRRNAKVLSVAARSGAIVSSLFPSTVRDRLFDQGKPSDDIPQGSERSTTKSTNKFKHFMEGERDNMDLGEEGDDDILKTKPIADLFPATTILFADIAGFTAWSSVREPTQVFTLLETIYRGFDAIAKKRGVFKVETIGDCYVAVVGLPEPRHNQ
jgi:hypothetical protein